MEQIASKAENISLDISTILKISHASTIIPRNLQWTLYIISLVLSDVVMAFLAFWLAYYLRFEALLQYFDPRAVGSLETYRILLYTAPILWLLIFASNGLYAKDILLRGTREYSRVFRAATQGFMLIVLAGFLGPSLIFARGWLFMTWGFTFLYVSSARLLLRQVVYALRRYGYFLTPAVIVGANEEGRWIAGQLLQDEISGFHIVGFVDKKITSTFPLFHNLACLGSVDQLGEIIERYQIGEVILASSAFSTRDYLLEIFRKYGINDKVNIRMSSGLFEIFVTGLSADEVASAPLVYVNKLRLTGVDGTLKFILDYLIAISSLIILFPLFVIIAILIKMSSPGPVLHKRLVMGLNGKQFYALKFRTMVTNGDEILEQYPELKEELTKNHKLNNDPRITRIGAFLRKLSLDELPQLFNVLKRDMSMVGPRMISPAEVAMYKQFDINLPIVLPGITGFWQVSGRSDISYDERVRLDRYYIRNWSLWLDLQLLFETIPAVLSSRVLFGASVSNTRIEGTTDTSVSHTAKSRIIKQPKIKISLSFPKLLSKRLAAHFKVRVYPEQYREKVRLAISLDDKNTAMNEQEFDSRLKIGTKIEIKLHSPVIDFSESVREHVSLDVQTATFTGIPKENCYPGMHAAVLTIVDPETKMQYSDISFKVDVKDFAFDHVSRPLLSNISTMILGIGSLVSFALTFVGQVDQVFGYTSGTTAAIIAV